VTLRARWVTLSARWVTQAYTTCEPSVWQSDHRPVVAVFVLDAAAVDPAAMEAAVREAYKEVIHRRTSRES
jgi:hypothetical protein